jgi:hypothetical protein
MPNKPNQPEQPRREPEILPPGEDPPRRDSNWPGYGYSDSRSTHRIYVGRIGPLGFALVLLMAALFGGVLVLALIGAVLIWFPIVAVLALIGAVAAIIRRL